MPLFKPTYLYIKQHNQTGLKYFGKTSYRDPVTYKGSGKYWKLHLKKHGNDVSTLWFDLFTDERLLTEYALTFSKENDIVESSDWANLKPEDGLCGGAYGEVTAETRRKTSNTMKGRVFSETHPTNLSKAGNGHKDTRSAEAKASFAAKTSAKLKGKKKPDGFGEAVGNRLRGTKMSDSAKENMKAAWTNERRLLQSDLTRQRNSKRDIITCPHCSFQGTNPGNMDRYHFDNCYLIKPKLSKPRKVATRAMEWHLLSPAQELIVVVNMRKFCRENNLNNGTMSDVALGNRKQHKGWKVISVVRDGGICS